MTPDGILFLAALAIGLLLLLLWIFSKARANGGVVWGQTCIVVDRDNWLKAALIKNAVHTSVRNRTQLSV